MATKPDPRIAELLEAIADHGDAKQVLTDELALVVYNRRQEGSTVRRLAVDYGVPPSSIHVWTKRGEELQKQGRRPSRRKIPRNGTPGIVLPVWSQWVLFAWIIIVPSATLALGIFTDF